MKQEQATIKKERIPRQYMAEQGLLDRVSNFNEVPLGFTIEQARLEASRCLQCKRAKCMEACPVGINIPGFIGHIARGDLAAGFEVLKGDNVLPAICGRVCPQEEQCEKACILGRGSKATDEPVAIGGLERFLADHARNSSVESEVISRLTSGRGALTGKKVAVVGSGPAGLTVAWDCAMAGHSVTIFEALHKVGGVLVYGIPEFRLPKSIVAAEAASLQRLGVEIRTDFVVGRTATVDQLLQTHDALFIGTGAGLPRFMEIPGENLNGVYSANEYLTRSNLMQAYRFPDGSHTPIARGGRVAVVGGGNVAMDAARTAIRLGAEEVSLVYRRSRVEMPARHEEITRAEEEGVKFNLLCNPVRYLADETGRVAGVECSRMELGKPDESGRCSPVTVPGANFELPVDTVVVAIGNGPNPLVPQTTPGLGINPRKGTIVADPDTCKTDRRGVLAGGDIVLGAATVILAMGAGRKAARAIDAWLRDGIW